MNIMNEVILPAAVPSEKPCTSQRLLLATTVPETLATILIHQPRHLARYFEVALVTGLDPTFSQVVQNEGLEVFKVDMARGIRFWRDLLSVARMIRVVRHVRPTLLHSYTPKAGLVCMLAAFICRVPIRVHTFTGLIFPTSKGMRRILLIWIDRLICACATHLVPEGDGVKKDLHRFNITRKPLNVIGHGNIAGVETTHFSPMAIGVEGAANQLRQELSIRGGDFLFCFVGRLNRDKGLVELISAFKELPLTAHLVLVGGVDQAAPIDGDTFEIIQSHPRVHQLGFVDDIRPALQASDVLVLPSYREGFPNVLLQAGSMCLPVIATNISGCNEVIEPGYNGWLIPPRDTGMLEHSMRWAMATPASILSEMGQRGRDRVEQRFERTKHWERMVSFYKALFDGCQEA